MTILQVYSAVHVDWQQLSLVMVDFSFENSETHSTHFKYQQRKDKYMFAVGTVYFLSALKISRPLAEQLLLAALN